MVAWPSRGMRPGLRARRVRGRGAGARRAPGFRGAARGGLVLRLSLSRGRGSAAPDRGAPPHAILMPAGLVLSAALVWVVRPAAGLCSRGRALSHADGRAAGRLVRHPDRAGWLRGRDAIARSALAAELARPIAGPRDRARTPARHLSHRARRVRQLRRAAGAVRLRQPALRGQPPGARASTCPDLVRSNYVHTLLSLPSLLNSAHLTGLERELGTRPPGSDAARTIWWSTTGWRVPGGSGIPLRLLPVAVVALHQRQPPGRCRVPTRGPDSTSCGRCRAGSWSGPCGGPASCATSTGTTGGRPSTSGGRFTGLATVARSDGAGVRLRARAQAARPLRLRPRLRDRCRGPGKTTMPHPTSSRWNASTACCSRPCARFSGTRHGAADHHPPGRPRHQAPGRHRVRARGAVPPDAARERVGAFGAYYLPDGGAEAFGDTVTVVNVLGNVLRHYFGARPPPRGDEHYLSSDQSSLRVP